MAALPPGRPAPEISLPLLGGGRFELRRALERGPVLLAFFKITCPICQFAFPYIERVHQAYPESKVSIVGVSQNEAKDTQLFVGEYRIGFPIALDDTESFPASNAYGLTNVPTLFLVGEGGGIELSSVGWVRGDLQRVSERVAQRNGVPAFPVFKKSENVPDFKAG